MSAGPATKPDEAPATVPQTPPPAIGLGHPEYHFVQAAMEMQRSLGEVKAAVDGLKSSVDSIKSKVDDLVGWKNKIIGGAAVLGAILTLLGIFIGKFWDYVTIKAPERPAQISPAPPQPTLPLTPKGASTKP